MVSLEMHQSLVWLVILEDSIHIFFFKFMCSVMLQGTPSQVRMNPWPASSEGHLKEDEPPFKMVSFLTTLREVNGHLRSCTGRIAHLRLKSQTI